MMDMEVPPDMSHFLSMNGDRYRGAVVEVCIPGCVSFLPSAPNRVPPYRIYRFVAHHECTMEINPGDYSYPRLLLWK